MRASARRSQAEARKGGESNVPPPKKFLRRPVESFIKTAVATTAVSVTTRPAYPAQLGGRRARPCRRVVLSGNTRPGRKPRRAHTHGVDRGKTPRAANTSCVTGSLLARVEGLEATLTPRPLIPSVPLRPSENPPSDTPKGTLENPPLRAHGASLSGGLSSFGHRLE